MTEATFNKETGEFTGELSDEDVYFLMVDAGMLDKNQMSLKDFLIFRDLLKNYSPEEALQIAMTIKSFEKYGQK